jgi:hypothetical protein
VYILETLRSWEKAAVIQKDLKEYSDPSAKENYQQKSARKKFKI